MAEIISSVPRDDGFYIPAEWSHHAKTWMLWPERPDNWRLSGKPAQAAFKIVAESISEFEPVVMGVNSASKKKARAVLPKQIAVHEIPNNDAWMRDNGPTFLIDGKGHSRIINWQFNAWGGLYRDWALDQDVPIRVAELEGLDYYHAPLVMEGGSFHVDGDGTLLTTEECLLNPNRNPHLGKPEIEKYLHEYTGARKIIWLSSGVYNDETGGHVDNLVCFLRPGVLALTWTDDRNDPQYPISRDAFDRLNKSVDARGRKLEILKIPQPEAVVISPNEAGGVLSVEGTYPRKAGDRLAASYINFYFCNGGVIVPIFNDENDNRVLEIFQKTMPERRVVGVQAREILLGGGNIHCITQQQPKE
ncbi:MAG: agmatine deiminase [Chloroflexota bacterium]